MKRKIIIPLSIIALVLSACGPTIEVRNNTRDNVRVTITNSNQTLTVSPKPDESLTIDVNAGTYSASVISAEIWNNYAKSEQAELMKLLDQPDKLTETQIKQIVDRMGKIIENEQKLIKSVKIQSTCKSSLSDEKNGQIGISGTADSTLYINCIQVDVATAEPDQP
ncbi:MAG: hypothetical protein WCG34_03385 [Leptolinea sp.]